MFKKLALILFCLGLHAEISDEQMQDAFAGFKAANMAILAPAQCANSILFLEKLTGAFRRELVPAQKAVQIEMMEKILYRGAGVGGFSGRACNAKEYAIMTEAAVILELWHRKKAGGTRQYFISKALASDNVLVKKHYQVLKYVSIVIDTIFDEHGTKRFFKDAIPEVVEAIKASEADMTVDKLLRIPAMRQIDVLITNLQASLGFVQCEGNRPEDYAALDADDGLNALRTDMHALMSAETVADTLRQVDAIEAKCWALPLTELETMDLDKKNLIGRAFAAVERIKSVRLDGTFLRKDPRAADDKLAALPVPAGPTADAIKKKNTLLLLRSMALQEYFYNPLNTTDDIKKIVLAKLQQSNYWEGVAALLIGKTDLAPYPTDFPEYVDDEVLENLQYAHTVPKVYPLFVSAIEQLAMTHKSGIYHVGGNRFMHLASSGAEYQCGFFSFGLMDDGGASNARRKFFDIFSNSLELQTLYDAASMTSVLEWISNYAADARKDTILGTPEGVIYPSSTALLPFLARLNAAEMKAEIRAVDAASEVGRKGIFDKFNFHPTIDTDYDDLEKGLRETIQSEIRNNSARFNILKNNVYISHLRKLLITEPDARKAFSAHAIQVLAGKLLPEEKTIVNSAEIVPPASIYASTTYQLLFRPNYSRYIVVTDPENRVTAPSPMQSIAEALNINTQVITPPGIAYGVGLGAQHGELHLDLVRDTSRAFSPGYNVLQDILVKPSAKNHLLLNQAGGHYEKLISLSDPVALARGLRHLAWKGGHGVTELK